MNKLDYLKLLADETRLAIIELLAKGEECACNIVPYTKKSQPNVSLHLKKLEQSGLLESKKQGTRIVYRIKDKKILRVLRLLEE